jgi:hypothetical protein
MRLTYNAASGLPIASQKRRGGPDATAEGNPMCALLALVAAACGGLGAQHPQGADRLGHKRGVQPRWPAARLRQRGWNGEGVGRPASGRPAGETRFNPAVTKLRRHPSDDDLEVRDTRGTFLMVSARYVV